MRGTSIYDKKFARSRIIKTDKVRHVTLAQERQEQATRDELNGDAMRRGRKAVSLARFSWDKKPEGEE